MSTARPQLTVDGKVRTRVLGTEGGHPPGAERFDQLSAGSETVLRTLEFAERRRQVQRAGAQNRTRAFDGPAQQVPLVFGYWVPPAGASNVRQTREGSPERHRVGKFPEVSLHV